MAKFIVIGKKWFDKVNGNTYHNAKIIDVENEETYYSGFQYGYGSQYLQSAREKLDALGFTNYQIIDGGSFNVNKKDCRGSY